MATNPNDVRLTVFMSLQEAYDEESCLEEQMLNLMHCFADRFTRHTLEISRLKSLPDHPLIDYGRYALERMTVWSDLPSEKRTEVMETIWAMWDAFLTENPNATSSYSSYSGKSDVVAKFFDVSLITLKDIYDFTKDLELGKYALWSEMTCDTRKEVLDNISTRWNALVAESKSKGTLSADNNMSSEVSPNDPIVQSIDIHEKPSSCVGAAGGSKPEPSKSKVNFRSLFSKNLCEGANVSIPRKVVERIMMNSKGFFFFQFKTLKGLEDFIENGPWMIRNSPIILKKWSMNTRLCKKELTRIPVWVKIHDVPIQGRSSFARCLIEINAGDDLKDSLTLGVPLIEGLGYTIETITIEYEWKPPRCDLCKIFGHVHDHCPKKVSSPPTIVTSNVVTPTGKKTNDGFQTANTSAPNKGAINVGNSSKSSSLLKTKITSTKKGNITMSNSYSALDDEDDEEVENVYGESANIFQSTKTVGSSSTFTAAAG
ncbi:zinc knuckle CX2CX4HX4C containing protein [Tanacetum coccineum]|uniref:Zinc knuckle CX2CX4HX4C containing protein n=1 Tax=Tanacetum coccineum TaxID=301880 RepID=A0ABQ5G8Z9_9ASTR